MSNARYSCFWAYSFVSIWFQYLYYLRDFEVLVESPCSFCFFLAIFSIYLLRRSKSLSFGSMIMRSRIFFLFRDSNLRICSYRLSKTCFKRVHRSVFGSTVSIFLLYASKIRWWSQFLNLRKWKLKLHLSIPNWQRALSVCLLEFWSGHWNSRLLSMFWVNWCWLLTILNVIADGHFWVICCSYFPEGFQLLEILTSLQETGIDPRWKK